MDSLPHNLFTMSKLHLFISQRTAHGPGFSRRRRECAPIHYTHNQAFPTMIRGKNNKACSLEVQQMLMFLKLDDRAWAFITLLTSVVFGSFNNKNGKNINRKDVLLSSLKKKRRFILGVGDGCAVVPGSARAGQSPQGHHWKAVFPDAPLMRSWPRGSEPVNPGRATLRLHRCQFQATACSSKMSPFSHFTE